ncbi:MAG: GTPase domain-containing protein [Planctomycetia bacterium]|jgi:hypothetical protein
MSHDFQAWSDELQKFHSAIERLRPLGDSIGVDTPTGSQWYELLLQKLLPQLSGSPLLVVGVVGGTNIGKSAIFNQLAQENASGVSPLAAGTKHPVCLLPESCDDPAMLARLFPVFKTVRWTSAEDALGETDENLLFYRVSKSIPERLCVLDTPDVDSDMPVNWDRARSIRQVSDVLIAVLTQQKYNDAAVKQFFREAVAADKPIVIVFNQCDLDADREYWPKWLDTFCSETGCSAPEEINGSTKPKRKSKSGTGADSDSLSKRPELVYVVPMDRKAADERQLKFYKVDKNGQGEPRLTSGLSEELARFEFDRIKLRTLRGAMDCICDPRQGAADYLEQIRRRSDQFHEAYESIAVSSLIKIEWPALPSKVLIPELRAWWDEGRPEWSKKIHGAYRWLGEAIVKTAKVVVGSSSSGNINPEELMHEREKKAVLASVEHLFDELDRIEHIGNDILKKRLGDLLRGETRQKTLDRLKEDYEKLPTIDRDYRDFIRNELDAMRADYPKVMTWLRAADQIFAVSRPAITLSLIGFGIPDILAPGQLAIDVAITGGLASGNEALFSGTGAGMRQAIARLFNRLQGEYAKTRATWLSDWIGREIMGNLYKELQEGATVTENDAYQTARNSLGRLVTFR